MAVPQTPAQLAWEVVAETGAQLGERPVWDPNTNAVIWVDISTGNLHRFTPHSAGQHSAGQHSAGQQDVVLGSPGVPVGAAAPRAGGGYVLAAADGFRLTDADGLPEGPSLRPPGMPDDARFNDGACDQAGRFWAGTEAADMKSPVASLYRLDPDGSVTVMLTGIAESNGLGWSPDATVFYYTDSGEDISRVRAFGFDLAAGTLGDEYDLIRFGPGDGMADGLVVDAEGCLWIAMWEGGCVRRYSPAGELLGLYPVPPSRPTCPGFGGPGLDELYLTTAWEGMTDEQRAAEPLAGHLLRARPGVRGLPQACYGG
jgi:sugar lactone lactonase YvrE